MDNEIEPTVTIDGTQYAVNSLSDRVKYALQQIQSMQGEQQQLRAKIDQFEMAVNGFLQLVREELDKVEEDDDDLEE